MTPSTVRRLAALIVATTTLAACGTPTADDLRSSFTQQLTANRFVKDVQRNGDEVRFSGPGAEGQESASWRVHIDEATVEANSDAARPHKGVVKSSWYANDRRVVPSGADSNLPIQLTSNGLAQECWAFWDKASGQWSWE